MTTIELQRSVIERVGKIENEELLLRLYAFLSTLENESGNHWDTLPENEKQRMFRTVESFRNGMSGTPHEVIQERYRKWL